MSGTRILAAGGSSAARVLVVDKEGNADYTVIQDALDAANTEGPSANEEWLVVVAPGNYQESLTLYDYVHLAGLGPKTDTVINPNAGNAISNAAIMTLANLQLAGDGSNPTLTAATLSGTMILWNLIVEDDTAEVAALHINASGGTFKIYQSDIQAGGPAIDFSQGTVEVYHSQLRHHHLSGAAAAEGAIELNNTGTIHLHHCLVENTSPTGPAIDFKASPTEAKFLHCILRMASGYTAAIDADVAVSPVIAGCIGNGDLHANVSTPISYTWDSEV